MSQSIDCRLMVSARCSGFLSLLMLWLLASGCATVSPTSQLAAYHEAFQATRQVSKHVLLEAAVDWEAAERIQRIEPSGPDAPRTDRNDWLALDLGREADDAWTVDDQIGLRLRFWLVAERYNKALLALAERRPREEVHQSMLHFSEGVSALPIQRMSRLGGSIGTLGGVLSEVIAIIDDRIAQRRFEEALEHGGPIVEQMLGLLTEDITDFYDLRLALYHRERRAINETLQLELLPAFRSLYLATGASGDKRVLFDKVSAILADDLGYRSDQLPDYRDGHAPDAGYTPSDHSQLTMLVQEIRRQGEARRLLDVRMQQYQDLLIAYHRLLTETASQLHALQRTVQDGVAAPPEELLFTALAVYRELIRYRRGGTP